MPDPRAPYAGPRPTHGAQVPERTVCGERSSHNNGGLTQVHEGGLGQAGFAAQRSGHSDGSGNPP